MTMQKVLVYTLHKAASMFIHKINGEIAKVLGVGACSINNKAYQDDIFDNSWRSAFDNYEQCLVYGPIRISEALPNFPLNPQDYSIVVHARDPRDALTSFYFSMAYSHPAVKGRFDPSEQQRQQWIERGIDTFVLEAMPEWKNRYDQLIELQQNQPQTNIVRYEDMVLHFDRWLIKYLMSFKHLVPNGETRPLFMHCLQKFQSEFKILPEDVYRHKRKMVPGDHKEKLAPETIAKLNDQFSNALELFGYSD